MFYWLNSTQLAIAVTQFTDRISQLARFFRDDRVTLYTWHYSRFILRNFTGISPRPPPPPATATLASGAPKRVVSERARGCVFTTVHVHPRGTPELERSGENSTPHRRAPLFISLPLARPLFFYFPSPLSLNTLFLSFSFLVLPIFCKQKVLLVAAPIEKRGRRSTARALSARSKFEARKIDKIPSKELSLSFSSLPLYFLSLPLNCSTTPTRDAGSVSIGLAARLGSARRFPNPWPG